MAKLAGPVGILLLTVLILSSILVISAERQTYSRSQLLTLIPDYSIPPVFNHEVPDQIARKIFPSVRFKKKRKSSLRRSNFIFQNVHGKDSFLDKSPNHHSLVKACVTFFCETMKLETKCVNTFNGKKYFYVPAVPADSVDGRGRPSGGLEFYISPSLNPKLLSSSSSHLAIHLQTIDAIVIGVYFKPTTDPGDILGTLDSILDSCPSRISHYVLGGDFNIHTEDIAFWELNQLLTRHGLGICSDSSIPTFYSRRGEGSTLDYIFTSLNLLSNSFTKAITEFCPASDHSTLKLRIKSPQNLKVAPPKMSFSRKIDFNKLETNLSCINPPNAIDFHLERAAWVDRMINDASTARTPPDATQ